MAQFMIPEKVYIGKDAFDEALPEIKKLGTKALIVTGKHVAASQAMSDVLSGLAKAGISNAVFDGITGEPTDVMISQATEAFIDGKCNLIIGVGGGSPMDSAKAVSAKTGFVPIVAVPTTAGTGSEATRFTVITDSEKDIKELIADDRILPKVAVVDPEYSISSPQKITAQTGLDALTHAVEAYTSKKAGVLTDAYSSEAVRKIMKYLPVAYEDGNDIEARTQMSEAAFMAGVCISNSSVTIVHGMSRPIGALYHVPHGLSNAMLLPDALRFALPGAYDRFAYLGRITHRELSQYDDKMAAEKFIDDIESLCKVCRVPTLKEYGIREEEFKNSIAKMSHDAIASGSPGNTRREVTEQDCANIYEKVYRR